MIISTMTDDYVNYFTHTPVSTLTDVSMPFFYSKFSENITMTDYSYFIHTPVSTMTDDSMSFFFQHSHKILP